MHSQDASSLLSMTDCHRWIRQLHPNDVVVAKSVDTLPLYPAEAHATWSFAFINS